MKHSTKHSHIRAGWRRRFDSISQLYDYCHSVRRRQSVSSARTRWHWEPRGTGTGVCAISGVGLRNGPCSLSEASVPTSSLEKDNLCALHRSLTAGEVGLCTSLHWKAVVQSDADAAISVAHFVSQADHRPHADPPSTGRASDRLRLGRRGSMAIAIPNARRITPSPRRTTTPSC